SGLPGRFCGRHPAVYRLGPPARRYAQVCGRAGCGDRRDPRGRVRDRAMADLATAGTQDRRWGAPRIVGFMIRFPLTKTLFGELSSGLVVAGVEGAVVGATVGALQWLVLRGRVAHARWWVLASTLAWMVSAVLGEVGALAAGEDFVADLLRVILGA